MPTEAPKVPPMDPMVRKMLADQMRHAGDTLSRELREIADLVEASRDDEAMVKLDKIGEHFLALAEWEPPHASA